MALAEHVIAPLTRLRAILAASSGSPEHERVLRPVDANVFARSLARAEASDVLHIPCPDPTAEERSRDNHQDTGLNLARQDAWSSLSDLLHALDVKREKTNGGMPVAELVAFGARADVLAAVEHALALGHPAHQAPLLDGIEALELVLEERGHDPMIAAIVAHAHIDIAWAWRGTGQDYAVPSMHREAFDAHMERARDILAIFETDCKTSPLLASVQCAANAGGNSWIDQSLADYQHWIDLDPHNTHALRAMGRQIISQHYGGYTRLDTEARRIAGQTHDIWGSGAYTWLMMDAISIDDTAMARLDLDLFIDGLHDILDRTYDQHTVNLLAAYCATTIGTAPSGHDEADYVRGQIAFAGTWIARHHLRELHPMLWAHAVRGHISPVQVRCTEKFAATGRADAMRFLNDVFHAEIALGQTVVFGPEGVVFHPA